MMATKQFIIIGLVLAIIVGVVAVFMASGDPDGLESSALMVQGEKTLTGASPEDGDPEAIGAGEFEYESPLPDYSLGEEAGTGGALVAVVLGIFITFGLAWGISAATRSMRETK